MVINKIVNLMRVLSDDNKHVKGNYFNYTDPLYDSYGNSYSLFSHPPIWDNKKGDSETNVNNVRQEYRDSNAYLEHPIDFNIPLWDPIKKEFVSTRIYSDIRDCTDTERGSYSPDLDVGSKHIGLHIGDIAEFGYHYQPFDDHFRDMSISLYRGCGIMYNPWTKHYNLSMRFYIDTLANSINQYSNRNMCVSLDHYGMGNLSMKHLWFFAKNERRSELMPNGIKPFWCNLIEPMNNSLDQDQIFWSGRDASYLTTSNIDIKYSVEFEEE